MIHQRRVYINAIPEKDNFASKIKHEEMVQESVYYSHECIQPVSDSSLVNIQNRKMFFPLGSLLSAWKHDLCLYYLHQTLIVVL